MRYLTFGSAATVLMACVFLLAMPVEAKAYADPGSGALIWQSLVAVLAGVGFYWRRLFRFSKKQNRD
ncbi:MAG: hypothetical protein HY858_08710 [Candidatus Solibacter usitatus]|nr:hypothetical protein [Candidatus Solibacter usitatus]